MPCGIQTASNEKLFRPEYAVNALRVAGRSPLMRSLLKDSLWVVNYGLWHAVCPLANAPHAFAMNSQRDDASCNDALYTKHLSTFLDALLMLIGAKRAILWRETTAVHPSQLRGASQETLDKYRHFDGVAIRQLNANASHLLASRYAGRVQTSLPEDYWYAATRDRPDGTLPGDMRHYGAEVVDQLVALLYLQLCEVL